MELLQLRYFQAVARFEHMTKAADYLHVSQPTVSQMISRLEKELGVNLFDRQGKAIRLNAYGESFYIRINRILSLLDEAVDDIHDIRNTLDQKLIVGGWAGSQTLIKLITSFTEKYPHIAVTFIQSTDVNACDVVLQYSTTNTQPSPNSALMVQEELLLAIPNGNPLSRFGTLSLSRIRNESIIGPHAGKPLCECISVYCRLAGFDPRITLEYDGIQTLKNMLRLNYGLAFLPEKTWGNLEDPTVYKLVHIDFPRCTRSLYALWNEQQNDSSVVKLFTNYVRSYFNSDAPPHKE